MKRALFSVLIGMSALMAGSLSASADVVMSPPASCPDGSEPATCHGGPHCSPLNCMTDADCTGGAKCTDVSYCTSVISCAGMLPPDSSPDDFNKDVVDSACSESCPSGGACKTLKVCMPASGASSSAATSGSGSTTQSGSCSLGVVGSPTGLGIGAAALMMIAGIAATRRRRPRGRR